MFILNVDDGYNMDEDTDDEIERVQRKLDQESSKGKHKYKVKIRNRSRKRWK